ncbi:ABC transporter substrate-binding protein [Nonomuraea sp. NN258]|uniref:ABC transporter substrate-binding protein n=1 Tax=Nonomuraea antri TaxID=2730852 RepID=UPI00156A1767|nr:ABC transporter substrate-binding protein [Nonomuraea antri]NRQ32182.1 ABC transporter substrate-binding protein [Nonomuraea antri]
MKKIVLAAAVTLALTGCAGTDQAADPAAAAAAGQRLSASPALRALVEGARKEGALNLNWGLHARPNSDYLFDAFKQAYGLTDLKITVTPVQNFNANAAKLVQETKAGAPSSTDALLASSEVMYRTGTTSEALAAVDWTEIAPWAEGAVTADRKAVALLTQFGEFTYNTELISAAELPKTPQDVLTLGKPVASTPFASGFAQLGGLDQAGIKDYMSRFKPAGLIGCAELNRLASGEFAGLWMSCGKHLADVFKATGAPLETTVLSNPTSASFYYMGLPVRAPHPNAAKLWITWLVTPEAQRLLFEHEKADNIQLPGSGTAEQIAEYEAKGITFTRATYDYVGQNPGLYDAAFKDELVKLLTAR